METVVAAVPETIAVCRLPLANLRRPHTHLRRAVLRFRRELERAVLARGDGIGVYQAARIAYAATAMRQAMRCDYILGNAGEPGNVAYREKVEGDSRSVVQTGLSHTEWLGYSDRLIKARESVAKAIQDLGLDKAPDPWDTLHAASRLLRATPEPSSPEIARPGANGAIPESADGGKVALTPLPPLGSPNEWGEGEE
jgi:hypothetical protein